MIGPRHNRRAVALVAAALCTAAACSDPARPATPGRTEAVVRELMAPYEKQLGAYTVDYTEEDGHIGVYLRPDPAWDVDAYVAALPVQAAAARAILAAVPEADDADVCADGPWLERKEDAEYSTATKVLFFRDRLHRVPADLSSPALVVQASLRDQAFDIYVDPKIQTESEAWRTARKSGP